jgi:hypothetical protein
VKFPKLFGKKEDPRIDAMMDDASQKARHHYLAQQIMAISELSGIEGADDFQDDPNSMLAIELPFMWGWHFAYAEQAGEWSTSPSMRASVHMIRYMMDHHEFDLQRARAEAASLDLGWNEADPLLEAVQERGIESYANPEEPALGQIIAQFIWFQNEDEKQP